MLILSIVFLFFFHLFLKVPRDRTRHRIARPVQRTTTATAEVSSVEDTSPFSSTESYASKANRRRKFRPEFKSTTTTSNYEEGKNDDGDVKNNCISRDFKHFYSVWARANTHQ